MRVRYNNNKIKTYLLLVSQAQSSATPTAAESVAYTKQKGMLDNIPFFNPKP
jgi:hypothetical protein